MKKDYILGLSEEGFHRIAYTEWGNPNPDKAPLLCVHGLTRNGRDFDALAHYFSNKAYHVFCPDIVGRGDSDWFSNPLHYTYEQYVADMTNMIARMNAREVNWLGTSMGGLIGMVLASLPKTPIRRLILNDVGPQIPLKAITRLAKYAGKDPDFVSMEAAKQYLKTIYADFGELTDEEWQHLTETSVKEITKTRYVTKLDHGVKIAPAKSKLAWRSLLHPHKALEGILFDIEMWHIWRKVSCPVLVIHGKKSDILTTNTINKMKEIHANVTVIQIDDAGHAPALLHPSQHEMIYQWLIK